MKACPLFQPALTTASALVLASSLLLTGCTQFPALDRTITPELEAAPFPDLVPIEPLLAQATAGAIDPVRTQEELIARVNRLRARAARMRGSVLSGREKQRLAEGLQ